LIWGRRESVHEILLYGAGVATMSVAVSPAFAVHDLDDNGCKWCPSWRSDASSTAPPVLARPTAVCRLVRERIETRHGQAIYETRQVCA
jgi:hypothetical protein